MEEKKESKVRGGRLEKGIEPSENAETGGNNLGVVSIMCKMPWERRGLPPVEAPCLGL
jgi:hypothetical protein